ncbi:carbon-nitrogen family hydrolase [Paludifilum halophilum]|uniref:Carbon-nitrogen hydrolase n=1 Tax=Paludifilum halophilum TaxID=1642702 RepID=A0A235BCE7_9BACL|nr:carbon-nitrogen family hydrolase [Paludifilum halophilum]OYD09882.1 carbon-nitrogen hydrolase [Paludifilum halophilum]
MKISSIQMDIAFGQPDENCRRVRERVEQAVEQEQAEVVVLPEMWNTGYDLTRLDDIADRGALREWMSRLAREKKVTLVAGSIAEKDEKGCYNAGYVFSPDGTELAGYRKLHLFRLMEEEKYLIPGEDGRVAFEIGGHRAGIIICYDLRFPEMIRSLALDGMQILFVPAEWPHPRLNHWRVLNQARAVENQLFVVAVNRVGQGGKNTFCGHSMVIDPWGEILAEGEEEETILTVDIDLNEVDRVRRKIPVFKDRVPDRYRL